MDDIDYDAWGEFIIETVHQKDWQEGAILDIGCGTGNSTFPMFTRGFDVTGLDASADMLKVAREKLPPVPFIEADFTHFELDRTFTLIYSVFDSLNNLLDPRDFEKMARTVYAHLAPGGFFMFDVNTTVGLRDLWEAGIAEGWSGEVYYRWDHSFDEASKLAKVEAYCENEQQSFTEIHFERAYDESELRELLERAGFCEFEALTYPEGHRAASTEPRLWVVVKKPVTRGNSL